MKLKLNESWVQAADRRRREAGASSLGSISRGGSRPPASDGRRLQGADVIAGALQLAKFVQQECLVAQVYNQSINPAITYCAADWPSCTSDGTPRRLSNARNLAASHPPPSLA